MEIGNFIPESVWCRNDKAAAPPPGCGTGEKRMREVFDKRRSHLGLNLSVWHAREPKQPPSFISLP